LGRSIQALIFDLDDTLYREIDYVASGYRAVSRYAATKSGCSFAEIYKTMMDTLASQGRHQAMKTVLERYLHAKASIGELVQVYRQHHPEIRLFSGYGSLLQKLRRRYRTGIITDGLPEMQRRKTEALGLGDVVDQIVYTWEFGVDREKPHSLPFLLMLSRLDASPSDSIFIGDNFTKDCEGARQVGMASILVRRADEADREDRLERPSHIIDSLLELSEILRKAEACHEVA